MLYRDTRSTQRPSAVTVERYGEEKHVRMTQNVREETERTEGQEGETTEQTVFVYDEVFFQMDPEREEMEEEIAADFDDWWEYGSQEEEAEPTLEERVAAIEDYLIGGAL